MPESHPFLQLLRLLPLFLLLFAFLAFVAAPRSDPPPQSAGTSASLRQNDPPAAFPYAQPSSPSRTRTPPPVASVQYATPAEQVAQRMWPLVLLTGLPLTISWFSSRSRTEP